MDPKLKEALERLTRTRPDILAGIGKKRPTATQQAKSIAGALFDALVMDPTKRAAQAIWEQKPGTLALEIGLAAAPIGVPGRAGGRQAIKALAEKLAREIAEKGGASIRMGTHELLGAGSKGFAVGLGKNTGELVMPNPTPADIEKFILKNKRHLKGDDVVLGGWVDDKGVAHIEPSQLVLDKDEAIKLGKQRNQMAVWDFENMSEINTRPSTPGVVADSAVGRAVRSVELLARQPAEQHSMSLKEGNERFVFKIPQEGKKPVRVEIIGQRQGDDFRVDWISSDLTDAMENRTQVAGSIGPKGVRDIGRQIKQLTGAKTISGERISGARPGGASGREAQRALPDSALTTVLKAAFEPQAAKRHAATRAK